MNEDDDLVELISEKEKELFYETNSLEFEAQRLSIENNNL